jgi:hypothetical protein
MMGENKKYYDYLNNEIKEGMIIQHIQTKSPFTKLYGSSNPDNIIELPENVWKVICEYKITYNDKYNMLFADLTECEMTISQSLEMLLDGISLDRNCIAIKGISEKEQNYVL